jgi:penicillin-binding protein 2
VEDDYMRQYPEPFIFSHILGYTKSVDFKSTIEGTAGLEAEYDEILAGVDGVRIAYRDARGTILGEKKAQEARAGKTLTTTIDAGFQRYFYARFKEGLDSLGKTSGVGLAMNPKTGEILSLVSFPSFDNNDPAKYLMTGGNPLFNRAVSGVYSPGSTIKPLVALAALHEKLVTPEFTVYSKGYLELPNPYDPEKPSKFLDWKAQGLVSMYSALARSSNVYFYVVGGGCTAVTCNDVGRSKGLGINKLNEYWKIFGLDKKTGVDMPSEGVGFLPNPTEKEQRTGQPWRIGDTYNVAIGQGDLQVTPIRLLTFFSSLANKGKAVKPHLLLLSTAPHAVTQDYSSWTEEIDAVRQGVRDVVAKPYGTANALYDLPYKTSGKTGSAQIQNNAKTNAFFMGYGPSDDPELAILILVEDAKTGSLNAVPIGYDVMRWYYENRM